MTKMKILAEAHGALLARLDPLEVRVDRIERWLERLEILVVVVEKRVDRLETRAGA